MTEITILILYAYTALYMVLGVGLFLKRRGSFRELLGLTGANVRSAVNGESNQPDRAD